MPIYPSSNMVDQLYTEAVVSGISPASFRSDPAQIQHVNYSSHTLVRRGGSSSSGSSSGGSPYLMTPPDHSVSMILQPEAYYENTTGYSTSRNAGVTIVDPPQIAFNYLLASAGYIGQPYAEMDPNYGYDT